MILKICYKIQIGKNYKKKAGIYSLGIDVVKKFIKEHQVDCDWKKL